MFTDEQILRFKDEIEDEIDCYFYRDTFIEIFRKHFDNGTKIVKSKNSDYSSRNNYDNDYGKYIDTRHGR